MRLSTALLFFVFACCLAACDWFAPRAEADRELVAKAADQFLYKDQLKGLGKGLSEADSSNAVKDYINSWVHRQLMYEKASSNLPNDLSEIDEKVRGYRQSLVIYAYENSLAKQKSHAAVSDAEVKEYFEQHANNFILSESLYRLRLVHYTDGFEERDEISKLMKSNAFEDLVKLRSIAAETNMFYLLDDSIWIDKETLLERTIMDEARINRSKINDPAKRFNLDDKWCYYKIIDIKEQGEIAPLSHKVGEIRSIVKNARKAKIIDDMYNKVYKEGQQKGSFEIYE